MFTAYTKAAPIIYLIIFAMLGLGLLGILTAGFHLHDQPFRYFQRQLIYVGIGLVCMMITGFTNYQLYRFKTYFPYVITIILLAAVFAFGKQSWLRLIGGFHIQPSEIGKLIIIIYLAYVMSFDRVSDMKFWRHSTPIMLTCFLLIIPTALQPDFGTALVMTLITGYLLIIGGMPIRHILVPLTLAFPAIIMVPFIFPHVMRRILNFIILFRPNLDISQLSFHDLQLRLAMGSGGMLGKGFGQGLVKRSFLPASHTDSIFAVLVEEGGFLTGTIIILLFLGLVLTGEKTANSTPDRFGAMLVRGITFYIGIQAFLNIGVCLGLLPNTGVTLPFFSYGGSSMIVTLISVGILINISSQRQIIY